MEFILVTVILVLLLTLIERSIPTGPKSQPQKATAPAPQGDDTQQEKPLYFQGYFRPKNPEKYLGDAENIIFRSSLEFKMMQYLDAPPAVLKWQSEELAIRYFHPHRRKYWRYWPDFIVYTKHETVVVEVKPHSQRYPPVQSDDPSAYKEWLVNRNKWAAARKWCRQKGWRFAVVTERQIKKLKYH